MEYSLKGKEVIATVTSPVTGEKRVVGFTSISSIGWVASASRAEDEVFGSIYSQLRTHASIFLIVALGSFLFALYLSSAVSASIERLRRHSIDLGKGNLHELEVSSIVSEIKDLKYSINQMAQNLRFREQELLRAHDQLETRVQERTSELAVSKRALEEHASKLERLNTELEEFAWITAHDLQEPLRKIQTFGNRLQKIDSFDLKAKEDLYKIVKSASRMSILIHDIKSYTDITKKSYAFAPTNLRMLIDELLSDLDPDVYQKGARVEVGELPYIEADRTAMNQLFQNLIANAIKYAKENEPPVVRITGEILNGSCRIYVEDNGIGFEEKYADYIFKPFKRLHGKTSGYEGSGIGLAICRKVVEMHGGTITARSIPGEGSVFIITLPLKQVNGFDHSD